MLVCLHKTVLMFSDRSRDKAASRKDLNLLASYCGPRGDIRELTARTPPDGAPFAASSETDDADYKPEQEWNAPVLCVECLGRHQLRDRRSSSNAAANWRDFSTSC